MFTTLRGNVPTHVLPPPSTIPSLSHSILSTSTSFQALRVPQFAIDDPKSLADPLKHSMYFTVIRDTRNHDVLRDRYV